MDYTRQKYVGVLADSWEFQGRKWIFQLRQHPFPQRRAVYRERCRLFHRAHENRQAQHARQRHQELEVETPDDFTVVFITKQPLSLLLDRLDTRYIISKAAAEKYGDQADNYAIGTGPYKFVSWQRGGNLVLARNDDYWGAKAEIKEVILKGVKEEAARVAGLLSGQADVISNLPIEEIDRVAKHPRVAGRKDSRISHVFHGHERELQTLRQQARAPSDQSRHRSRDNDKTYLFRQR